MNRVGASGIVSAVRVGSTLLVLALFGSPACRSAQPNRVVLFAAASATDAVTEITAAFERETGTGVDCNFAASSALARQIETGAEADLFLSANEKWADVLQREGRIAMRVDLLGNVLVVVVPIDSRLAIGRLEDLTGADVARISLADPDSVPAGIYARQSLTRLGLWDRLQAKVVRGFDVRQALLFVERGEAEAGLVYATDAAISQAVRVALEIDPALSDPIRYPLALVKSGIERPAARQLFQYLQSDSASQVFRRFGFKIVEN